MFLYGMRGFPKRMDPQNIPERLRHDLHGGVASRKLKLILRRERIRGDNMGYPLVN